MESSAAIRTLGTDLAMVGDIDGAEVVHSHTWYTNFAGHLASQPYGIPHVLTAHSLESGLCGGWLYVSGDER